MKLRFSWKVSARNFLVIMTFIVTEDKSVTPNEKADSHVPVAPKRNRCWCPTVQIHVSKVQHVAPRRCRVTAAMPLRKSVLHYRNRYRLEKAHRVYRSHP